MSELQLSMNLQLHCQWATALCNTAININNTQGDKIVCVHTYNLHFNLAIFEREDLHVATPKFSDFAFESN